MKIDCSRQTWHRQTDISIPVAPVGAQNWRKYDYKSLVRCYLFPTRVLYSTIHAAEAYIDMFPAYYIFNCLLIILQFLNLMWTVLILRVNSSHRNTLYVVLHTNQTSQYFLHRLL